MNLKSLLKALKLNESSISMALGIIVILVAGLLIVNFIRNPKKNDFNGITENGIQEESRTEKTTQEHIVVKGENLWRIAENYYKSGYNWVDIARENNIKSPNTIEEGQKLTLPSVEPKKVTLVGSEVNTETQVQTLGNNTQENKEAISGTSYRVVHGDNLWKISLRAYGDGYQWVKISRENKLSNPGIIHPGNVLTVPR